MKYLLLVALALAGCASAQAVAPAAELPEPPSINQINIGYNKEGTVNFVCQQSEVNEALVWDVCEFHNVAKESKRMCITVSYQRGGDVIATSRVICSGPLAPEEYKNNYAAFTAKNGRTRLEASCGSNMVLCKLTSKEVVQ